MILRVAVCAFLITAGIASGFWRSFPPYILNDTDNMIEISVTTKNEKRTVSLKPHTDYVEGRAGRLLTRLEVRYASGRMIVIGAEELQRRRTATPVHTELWVIGTNSVQLMDVSQIRRFELRWRE